MIGLSNRLRRGVEIELRRIFNVVTIFTYSRTGFSYHVWSAGFVVPNHLKNP